MLTIQTAYPCVNCKAEIDPLDEFCHFCGAKQPGLENRNKYNVFYRSNPKGPFSMLYGGSPILEMDDIKELVAKLNTSPGSERFVGSYTTSTRIGEYELEFEVKNWYPIIAGQIGQDQGPRKIQVTMLESLITA